MTMYNKYFDKKVSFFFRVEKPSLTMGDVERGYEVNFKIYSRYNPISPI